MRLYGESFVLLPTSSITTAISANVALTNVLTPGTSDVLRAPSAITCFATFVYGAGGTTVKAWVQTSLDNGTTWFDIINFAFTTASLNKVAAVNTYLAATHATPTDASLADNTVNNGLLGTHYRVKITSTGTYTGTNTLKIQLLAHA